MKKKFLIFVVSCTAVAGCASVSRAPAPLPQAKEIRALPQQQRSEALLVALMALGVDYRNGGRSLATGFDCSGLVAHVFEEAYGIRLPRTALGQSEVGLSVTMHELEPGDLVFYDTLDRPFSHVGIYIGEDKFVHAPKSGAAVRVESLKTSYWTKRFNGARRIPQI
jgi:cell wall-associated NlpC family hydrolase